MIIERYNKQPSERKRYTINYAQWLDNGEQISAAEFFVDPVAVGGLEIDMFELGVGLTSVIYFASGGQSGVTYKVTVRITSTGGQVKEDEISFTVKDT